MNYCFFACSTFECLFPFPDPADHVKHQVWKHILELAYKSEIKSIENCDIKLCNRHFVEEMFVPGKRILNDIAIPTMDLTIKQGGPIIKQRKNIKIDEVPTITSISEEHSYEEKNLVEEKKILLRNKLTSLMSRNKVKKDLVLKRYDPRDIIVETPGMKACYSGGLRLCGRHTDMQEFEHETLFKLGDKFKSFDDFQDYNLGNARQWYYYYAMVYSQKNKQESYTFTCVYSSLKTHSVAKVRKIRKYRTNCPCLLTLRRITEDPDHLTIIYMCNHHNHPLTLETFNKLTHSRIVPRPMVKESKELLAVGINVWSLKRFVEAETGLTVSIDHFRNAQTAVKKRNLKSTLSDERVAELTKKIKCIEEKFAEIKLPKEKCQTAKAKTSKKREKNTEDTSHSSDCAAFTPKKQIKVKVGSALLVQNISSTPKKNIVIKRRVSQKVLDNSTEDTPKRSRLEERLQILSQDENTLMNVKKIQESLGCESQWNMWGAEQANKQSRPHLKSILKTPQACEINTIEYSQNPEETHEVIVYDNNESYIISGTECESKVIVEETHCEPYMNGYEFVNMNKTKEDDDYEDSNTTSYDYYDHADSKFDVVEYDTEIYDFAVDESNVEEVTVDEENVSYIVKNPSDHGDDTETNGEAVETDTSAIVEGLEQGVTYQVVVSDGNTLYEEQIAQATRTDEGTVVESTKPKYDRFIFTKLLEDLNVTEPGNNEPIVLYMHKYNVHKFIVHLPIISKLESLTKRMTMSVVRLLQNIYTGKAAIRVIIDPSKPFSADLTYINEFVSTDVQNSDGNNDLNEALRVDNSKLNAKLLDLERENAELKKIKILYEEQMANKDKTWALLENQLKQAKLLQLTLQKEREHRESSEQSNLNSKCRLYRRLCQNIRKLKTKILVKQQYLKCVNEKFAHLTREVQGKEEELDHLKSSVSVEQRKILDIRERIRAQVIVSQSLNKRREEIKGDIDKYKDLYKTIKAVAFNKKEELRALEDKVTDKVIVLSMLEEDQET